MVELGELQDAENRKLGLLATEYATDIIPGRARRRLPPSCAASKSTAFDRARVQVVDTLAESVAWYQRHLRAGDAVLFF